MGLSLSGQSQKDQNQPQRFDFGKMWTFENPPKDWFKEAYNFAPPDSWYDDVRQSALRFASWCSASFISPDGLIMT
ncbi:MAG: S46 family peptidase, partial [Saprospiraceae bacterium]|nr:S46 family peptidase [Saprospiraceae bacterium]